MYTNTKATLYNGYVDSQGLTKYKRTVLDSVHWEGIQAISRLSNSSENADTAKISIPFNVVTDSVYAKPKAFNKLSDKSGYFTLNEDDKIAKGIIPSSVLFKDLENDYDDVVNIVSVDTADYGSVNMHHWELVGR